MGARVFAIPDGDVVPPILTCMPDSRYVMYGIGGAPEGVISAAVIRALGGDMQGRLLTHDQAKATPENVTVSREETKRCEEMGVIAGKVLQLEEMASSDNVVFSATGITKGVTARYWQMGQYCHFQTLVIRSSPYCSSIQSTHYLDRKDMALKRLFCIACPSLTSNILRR